WYPGLGGLVLIPHGDEPERLAGTAVTPRLLDLHHLGGRVLPQPGVDFVLPGLSVAAGEREPAPRPERVVLPEQLDLPKAIPALPNATAPRRPPPRGPTKSRKPKGGGCQLLRRARPATRSDAHGPASRGYRPVAPPG